MKEEDYEKEQNACLNAYKQLAEAESAISHVFAVFNMKAGAFKNFNEELYRVKHTIDDLAYNSKRIRDCCSIIQDYCIEPELEYEFSDHLNVINQRRKPHGLPWGAVSFKHKPFTIKLTRVVSENVQPIEYCCDTGYKHIGVSVKSEKHEYYDCQFDMLHDEKKTS